MLLRSVLLLAAVVVVAAGCGGENDDGTLADTGERDCLAAWNGPENEPNRTRIVTEGEFEVASIAEFHQIADFGEGASEADRANAEREGCSYLFHTDDRYLTLSGTWEGDALRWGMPPTGFGAWSLEQDANVDDNAAVAADGRLRKRPAPAAPTDPPPTAGPVEPPPPAWIETKRGNFWLGYSTFCWESGCADYVAPSCAADEQFVPKLVLDRGEIVHAHLGFTPRAVRLTAMSEKDPTPEAIKHRLLPRPEDIVWRVGQDGPFHLWAAARRGQGGADASYVACVQFR